MRRAMVGWLLAGCTSPEVPDGEGPLGVNEVASHVTSDAGITDDRGEVSDWLEILNDDASDRSLEGWTLWASGDVFTFPADTLASGDLLLVWADGEPDQGPLHTPFVLPEEAFELEVFDASGTIVQHIFVPDTAADTSFGRVPDDAPNWQVISMPSPARRNGSGSSPR